MMVVARFGASAEAKYDVAAIYVSGAGLKDSGEFYRHPVKFLSPMQRKTPEYRGFFIGAI